MLNRREFIRLLSLFLAQASINPLMAAENRRTRTLILVELKGGNDSLNAFVPYRDSEYFNLRPDIAIPADQVIPLNKDIGLHPALAPLFEIWDDKQLALVQNLGYEDPIRSHFRSIEIVDTGSGSNETMDVGWFARLLPQLPAHILDGVMIRSYEAGPLLGGKCQTLSMNQASDLSKPIKAVKSKSHIGNPALEHVSRMREQLTQASLELSGKIPEISDEFPKHKFGQDCKTALGLLLSKVSIPCIRLSLGGFDTHSQQVKRHEQLLSELATGLKALYLGIRKHGLVSDCLTLTYSEFGRRVAQNQSKGTDHGAAATHMLIGGGVNGGIYGPLPNLKSLDRGDLQFQIPWTGLYAQISKDFLQVSPTPWAESAALKGLFSV